MKFHLDIDQNYDFIAIRNLESKYKYIFFLNRLHLESKVMMLCISQGRFSTHFYVYLTNL